MTERDYGFGDFNNINLGNVEREIPHDADGLRVLQDAALKRFKTNSLEGKAEWIGEVLRSWQDDTANASGFWKNSPYVGKITKCKVNIPELDEAIGKEKPCPTTDPDKPGPHQDKINKFRTYESRDANLPPPPVGTKVRVTFEDPKNPQTSPGIYLGPVEAGAAATGMVAGQTSPGTSSPRAAHLNDAGRPRTVAPAAPPAGTTGFGVLADLALQPPAAPPPPPPRNTSAGPIQDRGVRQGIYWDYPKGRAMEKKGPAYWVKKTVDAGFTDVAIMCGKEMSNSSCFKKNYCDGGLNAKAYYAHMQWTPPRVISFAKEARKNDIRVSCVYWPSPNKKWVENFLNSGVPEMAVKAGLYAIEFDMEGLWTGGKRGVPKKYRYECALEADHALMDGLRKKLDSIGGSNIKINVTVHPDRIHKRSSCAGLKGGYYLINACDELYFQLYSSQRRVTYIKKKGVKGGACYMQYLAYRPGGKKAGKHGSGNTPESQEKFALYAQKKCQEKYKFSGPMGPGKFQTKKLNEFYRKKTGAKISTVILNNYGQSWNLGDGIPRGPGESTTAGRARIAEGMNLQLDAILDNPKVKMIRYWSSKHIWLPGVRTRFNENWHPSVARKLRGQDEAIG
jgi:hypothetical protein